MTGADEITSVKQMGSFDDRLTPPESSGVSREREAFTATIKTLVLCGRGAGRDPEREGGWNSANNWVKRSAKTA